MSLTIQQIVGNDANAVTSLSVTLTPSSSASMLLLVIICGNTVTAVSDTINGSYTFIGKTSTVGTNVHTYWVKNTTTSSLTVTVSWPAGYSSSMLVAEITGQAVAPIGAVSTGTSTSGTADMNSGSISGSPGDMLLALSGNFYLPVSTWTVGSTNPSGITVRATRYCIASSTSSTCFSAALLSGSYTGATGNNANASSNYGGTIGIQIIAKTINNFNDSVTIGMKPGTTNSGISSIPINITIGMKQGASDGGVRGSSVSINLGIQESLSNAVVIINNVSVLIGLRQGVDSTSILDILLSLLIGIQQVTSSVGIKVIPLSVAIGLQTSCTNLLTVIMQPNVAIGVKTDITLLIQCILSDISYLRRYLGDPTNIVENTPRQSASESNVETPDTGYFRKYLLDPGV